MNRSCKIDMYVESLFNNAYVKLKNILDRRYSNGLLFRFNENFHGFTFKTLGWFGSYKYRYDFYTIKHIFTGELSI